MALPNRFAVLGTDQAQGELSGTAADPVGIDSRGGDVDAAAVEHLAVVQAEKRALPGNGDTATVEKIEALERHSGGVAEDGIRGRRRVGEEAVQRRIERGFGRLHEDFQ